MWSVTTQRITHLQESRLQWYEHVERRLESYVSKTVEEIEENGARKRGKPKKKKKKKKGKLCEK